MTDDKTRYIVTENFRIRHHSDKQHFEVVFLQPELEGVSEFSILVPDDIVREMYEFLEPLPLNVDSVQ